MLKKLIFISFFLPLLCSPLTHGQLTPKQNFLEQLTPETIQIVAQEIEKLSPQEKNERKEYVTKNFQFSALSDTSMLTTGDKVAMVFVIVSSTIYLIYHYCLKKEE